MMLRPSTPRPLLLLACAAALGGSALHSTTARADDADKAACADKDEGDACTRGDGGSGTCVPDDSDPVLTCEDSVGDDGGDDNGSDDSNDDGPSCSVAGGGPLGGVSLALGMIVALARRRR